MLKALERQTEAVGLNDLSIRVDRGHKIRDLKQDSIQIAVTSRKMRAQSFTALDQWDTV
jgi:hypothetical protein